MYEDSLAFLRRWAPEGPWVLTAIHPDTKAITTETFRREDESVLLVWLTAQGESRNLYFHVNRARGHLTTKASKEDIAVAEWLHVDADPRAGESLLAEQDRLLHLFTDRLPARVPPPTVLIFSGGGYQAFWRLREPVRLGSLADAARIEAYNRQLELDFGGDHCFNIDRIMRLPGTVNRPDAKKRARGRVEAKAALVAFTDAAYALADFTAAALVQPKEPGGFEGGPRVVVSGNIKRLTSIDDLPATVSEHCRAVINTGSDPADPTKYGSRSEALWFVVCELVRARVDDETIYSVITDPAFAISAHVLDSDNPQRTATRSIARAKEHAVHPRLRELNERHAVIEDVGGKCRIVSEVTDGYANGRTRLSFATADDFRMRYLNQSIELPTAKGETTLVRLGDWWLRHPMRRQYSTIVFAPEVADTNGAYNLWKGFAYASKPGGSCEKYLTHVRDNICHGNEDHYRYLLGWMASAVQSPASPGHVAIVLRGPQGSGKSVFVTVFGRLFGRHFLHVSDPKHLVGSFNAHLRDTVVLFGDEAFYAGDKKHESVLKMLVTEEQITIEAKGVDAVASRNYVHLLMASNDDWVVPAGFHERRFFVLDVGRDHLQDTAYFRAILDELEAGGYEALLYHLRTYDLRGFDVRRIPKTEGLAEQKMLSLTPEKDWWVSKLIHGEALPGLGWPESVFVIELQADFAAHVKTFGQSARSGAVRLGMFLSKCFPPGHRRDDVLKGDHEVEIDARGTKRLYHNPRVYRLPPLAECRATWDANFGGGVRWAEPTAETAEEPAPF